MYFVIRFLILLLIAALLLLLAFFLTSFDFSKKTTGKFSDKMLQWSNKKLEKFSIEELDKMYEYAFYRHWLGTENRISPTDKEKKPVMVKEEDFAWWNFMSRIITIRSQKLLKDI